MSRSGYSDECENLAMWRGVVASATRGKRGQAFFRALVEALDAMPQKRLIANKLQIADGEVCAIAALGRHQNVRMDDLDPEDGDRVGERFNIARHLALEVVYMNDEAAWYVESPESRWCRMRAWASSQITK